MRAALVCLLGSIAWSWACCAVSVAAEKLPAHPELAAQARAVLVKYCASCHSSSAGASKGGFGTVLEHTRLLQQRKVVPNDLSSPLFRKIIDREMPPPEKKLTLSDAEVKVLRDWVQAGAPSWEQPASAERLAPEAETQTVLRDLERQPASQRRFLRYFSLVSLANAGADSQRLQQARLGLAKLCNSLSWHPRLATLLPINPAGTLLRLDLRDLSWPATRWEQLVRIYPYSFRGSGSTANELAKLSESSAPLLQADWFLATASRAPLYYELLTLPFTDRELERQLRVDVLLNLQEESAIRAGFNESGVSKNNRLLERHDAAYGAYWRSYDFSENVDRQNLFKHPLGAIPNRDGFVHAGGEMIFHLPNGLLGYMLVNKAGKRVDRAPSEIVSDPQRPDKVVEAGISCFACHGKGLLFKADQVRAHVEKNAQAFSADDLASVRALFVPEAKLKSFFDEDNDRYRRATTKLGLSDKDDEPILAATLQYEGTLDLATAAAELGWSPTELSEHFAKQPDFMRALGPIQARAGRLQRQTFLAALPELVRHFKLDRSLLVSTQEPNKKASTVTALATALKKDKPIVLVGLDSGQVEVRAQPDVVAQDKIAPTRQEIVALALSPTDDLLAYVGTDRVIHFCQSVNGRNTYVFPGHTEAVRCLCFAPANGWLVSGGQDRTVRLWNPLLSVSGKVCAGHTGWVNAVAVTPDSKKVVSASHDGTVRVWDLQTAKSLFTFTEHTKEVYAVALSPDGKYVASAGNDRIALVWELATGKVVAKLSGHQNAIVTLAFAEQGKELVTGSSQFKIADALYRRWDIATGKQLTASAANPDLRIATNVLTPDGRWGVTKSTTGEVQAWPLK